MKNILKIGFLFGIGFELGKWIVLLFDELSSKTYKKFKNEYEKFNNKSKKGITMGFAS